MSIDYGDWSIDPAFPAARLREQRSGLSGFGARPALHPAWCAPGEPESERPDRRGGSEPVSISRARR